MSLSVNENELLQAYELNSINPTKWEDVKRQNLGHTGDLAYSHGEDWSDPLGLRSTLPTAFSGSASTQSTSRGT